jgi:hypothetical protein
MISGTSSPAIVLARQVSGPGLYGGKVSGPAPAFGPAAGSPDACFAGGGLENRAPAFYAGETHPVEVARQSAARPG